MNNYLILTFLIWLVLLKINLANAQIEKVLVLDGCTNYFEVKENDLLDYDQVISIECWIQPNCEDENRIILSKQWCAEEFAYYLSIFDGKLFWSYSTSGSCSSPNTFQSIDNLISPNQFTHVAVVHNQSAIKLFVNGEEVAGEQNEGSFYPINNSSEPFRIGAYKVLSGDFIAFFSGLLDEIRVWNIELTESLIQQRMHSALNGDENGLVLYLDMEDTGQGASLNLLNKSLYGSIFDAHPTGFNSYSPYTIYHEDYNDNFVNLGNDLILCDDTVLFSVDIENYKNILWSTGETSNSISVTASGTYSVVVETEMCKFFRDTVLVDFSNSSLISYEFSICENDSITINNNTFFSEGIYYDTVFSNISCDTIYEYIISLLPSSSSYLEIDACPNSTIIYNSEELETGSLSTFILSNTNGCDSVVTVEVIPLPIFEEEITLQACEGETIEYNGIILFPNTSTEFTYISSEGCDSIVTVNFDELDSTNNFLGTDLIVCNEEYTLFSPSDNTLWNDGTISNSFQVTESGIYHATFIDSLGCSNSDTIKIEFTGYYIYVPNVFSPNGDGVNDCFKPLFTSDSDFHEYSLSIYNRWGALVFESSDFEECWDGEFKSKSLNPDVFVWVLEGFNISCNKFQSLKGSITLIK